MKFLNDHVHILQFFIIQAAFKIEVFFQQSWLQ